MKTDKNMIVSRQAGLTLVEIMVGLVIGLLATLVIMQVFSVYEEQKRTTMGTADAQTNGSTALYTIERDLQMAGYGLVPLASTPLNCATVDGAASNLLAPVIVTDGAGGTSDTITIHYGDSTKGGIPILITDVVGNDVTVLNNLGCRDGDKAIIVLGNNCAMPDVSAVPGTTTITLANAASAVVNTDIACPGRWNEIIYRVNNGNLERSGDPIIADIVSLQAQYGISNSADSNQVVDWVDAALDAGSGINWAAPTVAQRNRIKAVRVAVVARNVEVLARDTSNAAVNITAACSSTTDPAATGLCAWPGSASFPAPAITLANDPDGTSWQRYRYRVYETIIPLRNVIWSRNSLTP